MQAVGFPSSVPCGAESPTAWKIANDWEERWQDVRKGREHPAPNRWPAGSLGEAFDRFRRTESWGSKKPRTREDWERGWRHIAPIFGALRQAPWPSSMSTDGITTLKTKAGVRESHRAVKIWRALWKIAAAMRYCDPNHDPTGGIRRETPSTRSATWSEGEVVRLAKHAWRSNLKGLAGIIAVSYDTQLSPVDARKLTFLQSRTDGLQIWFELDRAKTGRGALGILSRKSQRVLIAYVRGLAADQHPSTPIFRTKRGASYTKNSLAADFRRVRDAVFPGDTRKLMDMRRTGAVEAMAGGADAGALSAKMANTLSDSKALQRAYLPIDKATVTRADAARLIGRRLISENKREAKVETLRPGELKLTIGGQPK
jgi:hypothetical protein